MKLFKNNKYAGWLLLFAVFIAVLQLKCGDDNGLGEDFQGITRTDYYANVFSIDADDWCGTLTPRYMFLKPVDCKILMPCSTLGDSVIDTFSVFNEWVYDIVTRVSVTDTNLTVTPDSVIIPVQGTSEFVFKYKYTGDSNPTGSVIFSQFEPSASKEIYFSAEFDDDGPVCPAVIPSQYELFPAYPNPAYAGAIIQYSLPRRSDVRISIYTPEEELVAVLVNDTLDAGSYRAYWNVRSVNPDIYDCRMVAGDFECRGNIQVEL